MGNGLALNSDLISVGFLLLTISQNACMHADMLLLLHYSTVLYCPI